jgi:hypothetical protein
VIQTLASWHDMAAIARFVELKTVVAFLHPSIAK